MSNYGYPTPDEIEGKQVRLSQPYKGYGSGEVVRDYGDKVIVQLSSGKEVEVWRDEVDFD